MKPKTVRGSGFRGLLDYQFRTNKPPEIQAKAQLIGGNMAGETPRELAKEFGQARKLRTDIRKPVWHCSLSLPEGEILTEGKWQEVVNSFLKKMEVPEENQFCIIRHSDTNYDHVHIALNRVNLSGKVWSYANDVYRAIDACQKLEKEFNLTLTPGFNNRKKKNDNTPKLTYREMQMISRTGEPSAKMKIKSVLDSLFQERKVYTPQEFCQELEKHGISVIPNIARRTSRMNGFAFVIEDINVKAGKCGWSWKKMSPHIEMSEIGIAFLQRKREEAMNEFQRENIGNATGNEGNTGTEIGKNNRTNSPEFGEHERKSSGQTKIVSQSGDQNLGSSLQRGAGSEEGNSKTEMEKNMPDSGIRSGNSAWDGVLDVVSVLAHHSGAFPESSHRRRHVEKKKSISVRKKEAAWQEQSAALGAEFYRITVVERGPAARRMNVGKGKGKNGEEKFFTAEEVRDMIPKLEFWNARGNDIYITPIDADYHYILADDLTLSGKKYVEENYAPVLVQSSSKNNWQAVLKIPRKEATKEEQSAANELMRKINVEAGGDEKISAVVHPFRMAAFCNKKPNRANEYTRIIVTNPGVISLRAEKELEEIRAARKAEAEKVERERRENAIRSAEKTRENRNILRPQDETMLDFEFREIWGRQKKFAQKMIENGKWQKIDCSRLDFRTVKELLRKGYEPEKIEEALKKCSPELASRHRAEEYAYRTIQSALNSLYAEQERKQKPKNEMEVEQFWEPTL